MAAVAAPADQRHLLLAQVSALPEGPGVYLMRDRAGQVIYVGKATDVRRRVRSYFACARDDRAFMPFLEREATAVEAIVVRNEKEALVLENELIKRHQPRFNVRLREGGQFVYLRLDDREEYPSLQVVRGVKEDGARYFGPYPAARALRETLRVINHHFQLRTCTDHDPRSHERPCLLCQISRFPEPSVYDIPPVAYRRRVEDAVRFLEGKRSVLAGALRRQMDRAARELRFEDAARLRDRLRAVETTLQPQHVAAAATTRDEDAVGCSRQDDRLAAYLLYVRHGRVIGGQAFPLAPAGLPTHDALGSFVAQYYATGHLVPDEVLLPFSIEGTGALAAVLSDRKGAPVRVLVPRRGRRRDMVALSTRNAEQALAAAAPGAPDRLRSLQRILGLARIPRRIECFDVSHLGGEGVVASKVAMRDGELDKDQYRRYRIKTVDAGDDYAAMHEVVWRRLRRGMGEGLPDLIVLDGGAAQLAAARSAAADAGVEGVDFVALAKERDIGEPGAEQPGAGGRRRVPERVFVPGRAAPIALSGDLPELLVLVRLRDEAHRFAVTYQRQLRQRQRLRSELDAIPGVGEKRRRALLRRFGSVARVREAAPEELRAVEGIGPAVAARVYAALHAPPEAVGSDAR